jgi:hypothetical protein
MPLELRRQRDGSLRDTWSGRFEVVDRSMWNVYGFGVQEGIRVGQARDCVRPHVFSASHLHYRLSLLLHLLSEFRPESQIQIITIEVAL